VAQSLYKRIIIKISGESLSNPGGCGIDPDQAEQVARRIAVLNSNEMEIGIVIGAGNLWRGAEGLRHGMERARADHIGMLATVMNALALADAFERVGIVTRVQTAIEMRPMAEPYIRLRAIRHLEKGRVVIFGAGTGNPYFTTDSAAALRAAEIGADLLIKATKVEGVYDDDPHKNPNARRFEHLTYLQALNMKLKVMDSTAMTLCMDNQVPIIVLNLWDPESLAQAVAGKAVGTLIRD